jgi:hypothetical protein
VLHGKDKAIRHRSLSALVSVDELAAGA